MPTTDTFAEIITGAAYVPPCEVYQRPEERHAAECYLVVQCPGRHVWPACRDHAEACRRDLLRIVAAGGLVHCARCDEPIADLRIVPLT